MCRYLRSFYEGSFFRSSKYSVYLAKKASQDRLVDRLRNVFGAGNKAVVVFWGNWGAAPNALRNGPPTPGIGLRRFVHRRLLHDRRRVESVAEQGRGRGVSGRDLDDVRRRDLQRMQRMWSACRERERSAPPAQVHQCAVRKALAQGRHGGTEHPAAGEDAAAGGEVPPVVRLLSQETPSHQDVNFTDLDIMVIYVRMRV